MHQERLRREKTEHIWYDIEFEPPKSWKLHSLSDEVSMDWEMVLFARLIMFLTEYQHVHDLMKFQGDFLTQDTIENVIYAICYL